MEHVPFALIKARGVIMHEGKIFLCKLAIGDASFYCLPGGTLEMNETLETGLSRELFEELGVEAKVGPLVYTQQIIRENKSTFDYWYWIENASDFLDIDLSKASHGFEHTEVGFYDPAELTAPYRPLTLPTLMKIW